MINWEAYGDLVVIGILALFVLLEMISGALGRTKRTTNDWIMEFGVYIVLGLLIKPGIVISAVLLGNHFLAEFQHTLTNSSLWLSIPLYLFGDDLVQYCYHRYAHSNSFLWKLHRPHHQAEEMGFFVSYRNAGLYYLMMPNIWWMGLITFLGGAQAVAIGLAIKQLVIISSHSTVAYDKLLYKFKVLRPLAFLLQRVIVTPAFHHSHHGKSQLDGVSDPNGNFGNMFSIWDQILGTASFRREFPESYGLENDPKEKWTAQFFYPAVASADPASEISRGFKKQDHRTEEPSKLELEKGKAYLWCRCGLSANQPFCDGSHHGTKYKPLRFEAKRSGKANLCQCKRTGTEPFCDGSHQMKSRST
ncbi:MAG: hypothetical protein HKN16_04290 [Saprospiraceae bacterium]|nr:hypothetical protein [Saprospiraceae bacterium]